MDLSMIRPNSTRFDPFVVRFPSVFGHLATDRGGTIHVFQTINISDDVPQTLFDSRDTKGGITPATTLPGFGRVHFFVITSHWHIN